MNIYPIIMGSMSNVFDHVVEKLDALVKDFQEKNPQLLEQSKETEIECIERNIALLKNKRQSLRNKFFRTK